MCKVVGIITRFFITVFFRDPVMMRSLKIELFWDNCDKPGVSAPFGDFFCFPLPSRTRALCFILDWISISLITLQQGLADASCLRVGAIIESLLSIFESTVIIGENLQLDSRLISIRGREVSRGGTLRV